MTEKFIWYAMIHFDGPYVNGFITIAETPEEARKILHHELVMSKLLLKALIQEEKEKYPNHYSSLNGELKRVTSFIRSFERHWRVTERGDPVLKMKKITSAEAGFWLKDIMLNREHCNLRTETVSFATGR